MASGSAIRAGRAFVELFLDDSRMQAGLKSAARRIQAFGAQVTRAGRGLLTIGAAVTGPLLAAAKHFASTGDELAKMSGRTKISVEALSELKHAAEQSGTTLGAVEKGIKGLNRTVYDAERGLSTATDALADMGVTVDELKDLKPEDQFTLIADRLGAIQDPSRRSALAMKVLGKSGHDLLNLFEGGAGNVSKLRKELRDLGGQMTGADAAAAADFTDAMHELWTQTKAVTFQIGAAVATGLTPWIRKTQPIIAAVISWARENRALVLTLFKVFAAISTAGAGLIVFGLTIQAIGPALRFLGLTMRFLLFATNAFNLKLKAMLLLLAAVAVMVPAVREKLMQLGDFLIKESGLQELFDALGEALDLPALPDGITLDTPDIESTLQRITGQIRSGAALAGAGGGQQTLGSFGVGTLDGRNLIRQALGLRGDPALTEAKKQTKLLEDIDTKLENAPLIEEGGP